jgi:hypothetical protein
MLKDEILKKIEIKYIYIYIYIYNSKKIDF